MLRLLLPVLMSSVLSAVDVMAADAPASPAPADTAPPPVRIVRTFPPIEVRATLNDMRASQTVHVIPRAALRSYPVDGFADVIALQAGVVAQGEELHVRGGRAGETTVFMDGLCLSEPLRRRAMEVPLLALRSAELVSGAPEAQYGCGLAGAVDMHTAEPDARLSGEWGWQTDGGRDTRYDRVGGRLSAPLGVLGMGIVAAGDATLDDTWLPALRSQSRHGVAGLSLGWRAENRILGYLKVAPTRPSGGVSAQVAVSRQVRQPYDPAWSLDGWTLPNPDPKGSPTFSPVPLPGYVRYRAADHLAMTDDRQLAALLTASAVRAERRASASLGWLRTRTVTSVGGDYESPDVIHRAQYGDYVTDDRFHVLWGGYPLYRESGSDALTLRGDAEAVASSGSAVKFGAGLTYEQVSLREMDRMPQGLLTADTPNNVPLDSVRAYRAFAPGGFAHVQGRWLQGDMIVNTGLRVEYFTAGPQAGEQTLPGDDRGVWSLSPRLGLTFPLTERDVFYTSYARIHQSPGRDYLYDRRTAITNRQPLGNPALRPSTVISYEAALKHIFDSEWALQAAVFYRDLYEQVGAREHIAPGLPLQLRYANEDAGHAMGFEWSLIRAAGEQRRLEAHYTWMEAWGNESRPEGDPYGPVRGVRLPSLGDRPLSWDRRHTLLVSGTWQWAGRWSVGWATLVGSPLPWTPKPRRQPLTDLSAVNSRRFEWTENTRLDLRWSPPHAFGVTLGLEARNLFDNRGERLATVDGYPNPVINTIYDDYAAYRTETGLGGGAYWSSLDGRWVPVRDPRLYNPPRTVRASVRMGW